MNIKILIILLSLFFTGCISSQIIMPSSQIAPYSLEALDDSYQRGL